MAVAILCKSSCTNIALLIY